MVEKNNDEPWEIKEDQYSSQDSVLIHADRVYCATGEATKTLSESTIKNRIKERAEKLPHRIQTLIDDILLMHYAEVDFLQDSSDRFIKYSEVTDYKAKAVIDTDESTLINYFSYENDLTDFGIDLGTALRLLCDNTSHYDMNEILWGILLGFYGWEISESQTPEKDIPDAVADLNTRVETYVELRRELAERPPPSEILKQSEEPVRNVFEEYDINVTEVPVSASKIIKIIYNSGGDIESSERIKKRARNIIEDYINTTRINTLAAFQKSIEEDIQTIRTGGRPGSDFEPLFENVWKKTKDSTEMVNKLDDPDHIKWMTGGQLRSHSHSNDTHCLKLMADGWGDRENEYEVETIHPVLYRMDDKYRVSDYGELVGYAAFERESTEWIYLPTFEEHLITIVERSLSSQDPSPRITASSFNRHLLFRNDFITTECFENGLEDELLEQLIGSYLDYGSDFAENESFGRDWDGDLSEYIIYTLESLGY